MEEQLGVDILLIEDNPGDIKLITTALAETDKRPTTFCVKDGIEAIQFLRKKPPFENAPRPTIIILDLNLPRKDGRSVLAEIKADPVLSPIPIVIFSGSDAPQDICTCYLLHANCYLVKPRNLLGMIEIMDSLVDFWLTKVKIPSNAERYIDCE